MIQHLTQFFAIANIDSTLFYPPHQCNESNLFMFGHQLQYNAYIASLVKLTAK